MVAPTNSAPAVIESAAIGEHHDAPTGPTFTEADHIVLGWLVSKTGSNATRQSYAASIGAPAHVRRHVPGGPANPRQPGRHTWLAWCTRSGVDPLRPRQDQIDRWLAETGTDVAAGRMKPASRTHAYRSMSALLGWAAHRGHIPAVTLPDSSERKAHGVTGQQQSHETTALPDAAVDALLWAADNDNRTVSHKPGAATVHERRQRSRVLLALLLGAGLRISELVGLDVTSYWRESPTGPGHLKITGKGGKLATQPLAPWAADVVEDYLRSGRITRAGTAVTTRTSGPTSGGVPLVTNDSGKRLSRSVANDIVGRLACLPDDEADDEIERAHTDALARLPRTPNGCPSVHPHQLRHATAHRIIDRGGDTEQVREFLRHASQVTTQDYIKSRESRNDRTAELLG